MFADVWIRARIKLRSIYYLNLCIKDRNFRNSDPTDFLSQCKSLTESEFLGSITDKLPEPFPLFIIDPNHKIKLIWNILMSIILLYTAIIMPYTLTFLDYENLGIWGIMDLVLDFIFFIDILINFCSAYIDQDGCLVKDRRTITINYLKSWFILDVVACFPFNFIGNNNNQGSYSTEDYNNFFRLLKMPRLYRLFRVARLLKMFKHYKNSEILEKIKDFFNIKPGVMKLITLSLSILLCVHLMACFWYYSAKIEGFNPQTWVARSGIYQNDNISLYIVSLYWSITTLCTVGYGDIHAQTNLEKILSMGWMIFSIYFLSFVIGSLSSMLAGMDSRENDLVGKLAIIDEFVKEAKLTKKLKSKIRYALKYSTEKTGFSWEDKLTIFNELPKRLKYEVSMAMHHGAARNISFFSKKDEVVISAIVPFLKPIFVAFNDLVYSKNQYSEEIYFIVRGKVAYFFGDNNFELTQILKGCYFGDIEVVLQIPRKYSAKASKDSELLIMNKELIAEITQEYPKIWDEIKNFALKKNEIYEIEIIKRLESDFIKKKASITSMDPNKLNFSISKRLKKMEKYDKLNRKSGSVARTHKLSLEDLFEKLESMCSTISSLEKEVDSIRNADQNNLEKCSSDSSSISND